MSKNKKIIYGILIGFAALTTLFIILLFSSPATIGPVEPKQITAEEAINLIAQNYPKTIEARGDINIPQEDIKQTANGWKIDIYWGLCPDCHCLFEVNHDGSIKILEQGEVPSLCEPNEQPIALASVVTITTDKTKYKQDEVRKITIKNNTQNNIEVCGESVCSMLGSFPTSIEKLENQAWTQEIIACPVNDATIAKVKNKIVNDSNYNCMVISKNNPVELEILLPQKIGTYRIVYFYSSDKKPFYSNEFTIIGSNTQITEITLTGDRGDFADPGPIEAECQKYLENYINGIDFINKKFSQCQLIESKTGVGDEQCPNGWSPQGCYICKLKCQ